jgi:two-component system, cell cycle sensor histidine kinase and response regulator CckA
MTNTRVLVVEDELIVAKDIQNRLNILGYTVPAIATSGKEAIEKVSELRPDLVLMDIVLKGDMDGVETAQKMREHFDIPIVYLTAYADESTLQRTKLTEPYGYILKPFEEIELRTTIEMALYKHKMEKKLEESEKWFASILRCIDDAVIATNTENIVTFINPVAEALTGWKQSDALGKDLALIFNIVDQQSRAIIENPAIIARREDSTINLTKPTLLISRDGKETSIETSAAPIKEDQKKTVGAVLIFRDITERKRLEDQLRQSQKMEAVGQLAGGVAHDFNNLLTIIIGLSDYLVNNLDPSLRLRHQAEEIKKAGEQAASLTRQLLAFSRKQILQPKVLDLNAVIGDLNKMLRRLIGENIEMITVARTGLGLVRADRGQLEQVILNLAVNARDAMPQGGKLTIEAANASFDKRNTQTNMDIAPGQYVTLIVSDTGCGMDAETQSHIFEPFFTTKEAGKGTGLGLATVYGIVQQSKGYIKVQSEPGRGTTFKIYLPCVEDVLESIERDAALAKLPGGSEIALVVEYRTGVRNMICDMLEETGYGVLKASNGVEALDICERYNGTIHLLITDLVMPQMSGKELARRMAVRYPNMKILYMSGYMDQAAGLLEEGAFFIEKPFAINDLANKVREILDL